LTAARTAVIKVIKCVKKIVRAQKILITHATGFTRSHIVIIPWEGGMEKQKKRRRRGWERSDLFSLHILHPLHHQLCAAVDSQQRAV